ncbi:MAG: LemA family protein [bacterium]|nr:LemA family protein [bacterium]
MIFAIILIVLVLLIVILYNKLVKIKNNVKNSFADVDVQIKARFNLVDNLVNTVKGYAKHEREVLENVTKARTSFMDAKDTKGKLEADNMLSGALKSLFAVSENYPDLKANQNFLQLQEELSDLENKIAAARRYYNASVKEYDNALESFPSNIIANIFGFKKMKKYFETKEEEKAVPKVDFSDKK